MSKKDLFVTQTSSIIALYSNGQYQEAIDTIKDLTKIFPDDSLLCNIMGACYAGLGQLALAVKSYKKAISIDPEYAKAHYNLGDAYHHQNKHILFFLYSLYQSLFIQLFPKKFNNSAPIIAGIIFPGFISSL